MSAGPGPALAPPPLTAVRVTAAGPVTQVRVVRAEWTKLRALRSTWWCALTVVVLVVGLGAAVAGSGTTYQVSAGNSAAGGVTVSLVGILFAQLVLGVLGVLSFSGEYATGMIRATLAAVPSRLPVLWAKLIVLAGLVLPLSLLAAVADFFVATALESSRGGSVISLTDPGVLREVAGASLYLTVIAVIGLALGALLRRTAAGLAVFAAVFLVVPLVAAYLPASVKGLVPYLPSNAGGTICGAGKLLGGQQLGSWSGFAVLCGYAVVLTAAGSFGSFSFSQAPHPAHPPLAASLVVAVLTALVLSLRRVWPGPVFAVVVVMAAVLAQWPVRGALFPVALAIALYTVAATLSRTTALVAAALAVAAEVPTAGQGGWHDSWLATIYEVTAIAAVLIAGLYAGTRKAYLAELRDRTQRLEREHDQTSALAAAVERARIAREMHDSVAHHLTVIVALSDGALAAVTRSPAQASEALRGVSGTARQALAETRRLLGILRAEGGPELRQPLPGLSDLDGLFTRVRAAGLPVRYERTGHAEADIEVVGEAADGNAAVSMCAALRPEVVLMDIRMPGYDGIEATRDIVAAGLPCKVLILTTFDLDDYVYAGLRAGASGFLLKDTQPADLVAAIHTIAAGDAVLAPTATTRLVRQFAAGPRPAAAGSYPAAQLRQALTSREQDVFSRIAAGMSNSEIAASLFLSEGTVKIHVGRILAKLGLRDRVQAVVLAYESRLITPGTPPEEPGLPPSPPPTG